MIDAPKNKLRAPIKPLNAPTLALSVLGLGFLRPAPGTWGSLPPPIVAAVFILITEPRADVYFAVVGAMLLLGSMTCVYWGRYAESRFGRKDAAEVVADETAGVSLALLITSPALFDTESPVFALVFFALCFFAFRFFDILKPWPARKLEALPHGWGVLMDDLAAGVYAGIASQITIQAILVLV